MSDKARDTQFIGFARLLYEDLPWDEINIDMERRGWEERWETHIAQRVYDLVEHTINGLNPSIYKRMKDLQDVIENVTGDADYPYIKPSVYNVDDIADMTTWPVGK